MIWKRVRRMAWPWPSRADRRARIEAARQGAVEAQRKAEEAHGLVAELRMLRRQNHVSEVLDGLIQRRSGDQR